MIESEKYKAEVVEGILKVWAKEPPVLVITTWDENGVEHSEKQSLPKPYPKTPVFAATYGGDGSCDVDLDCGFQRWNGDKTLKEVENALGNCGFTFPQCVELIVEMCKVEQPCPSWR